MGDAVFPFVVGSGRSGTTMLRAMLDSHPALAIPPESYFVASSARQRHRYEQPTGFSAERFCADLAVSRWFLRWGLEPERLRTSLAEEPVAGLPEAIRRVFALYARQQDKARYGDKTPPYVLNLPLLAGLLPEARFVHLIRDGRDVAASLVDASFGPRDFGQAVLHWEHAVRRGRAGARRLPPGRYLEIRYEQLVADPETQLRRIAGFVDLPYDPAMLEYHRRAAVVLAGVGRPEQHQHVREALRTGVRDWRVTLPAEHVALFEALAGSLRAELGDEPGTVGVQARARLQALQHRASREAHRLPRRLTARVRST